MLWQTQAGLKNRGDYKYALVSLWQDTKTVSCLSTNQSPQEVLVRHRQKDGRHVEVPCPYPIKVYYKFMGDVDIMITFMGIILYVQNQGRVISTCSGSSLM